MSNVCKINGMCLDTPKNTNVVVGSDILTLNDFEDMVNNNPRVKNKMIKIIDELQKY